MDVLNPLSLPLPLLQAVAETGWRIEAPFNFRFIVQPLMALLLAVRDGRQDAKIGTPPYLYDLLFVPADRQARLGEGLRAIAMPLIMGVVLDGLVQITYLGSLKPGEALLVGTLLVGLPYALARGLANRLAARG